MASPTQCDVFEQTLGDSEGQGSLASYSLWGLKELDNTAIPPVDGDSHSHPDSGCSSS